jgi:fatty acid-binding protein DegV
MFDARNSAFHSQPPAMSDLAGLEPTKPLVGLRGVRRTCLVVDASCDLPQSATDSPCVRVLPVKVHAGKQVYVDRRDRAAFAGFYESALSSTQASSGHSEPLTTQEMVDAFNAQLVLNFDDGLGVFVAGSRSPIYERAKRACNQLRIDSYARRLRAGQRDPMRVDCVDSGSLFAGYAAQALDLIDLLNAGADIHELVQRQHVTAAQTWAYMVPGDVRYILERAALKGEKSVSALAGWAAKTLSITPMIRGHLGETQPVGRHFGTQKAQEKLFEMAGALVREELLLSRHICFSYSGDTADISNLIAYRSLASLCARHHVSLHLEPMSMTGSINVGPRALVLGVLAEPHPHLLD